MRAQLRTYHAIPSLQAHQDPHAYKQLQDAPRLKSILKGGAEDRDEPNSLDKIKQPEVPRTNPVNLIFVMCNAASKIAELHFPVNHEFHDLIMKTQYTSQSRARAFLWLMWFHLESDFTEEGCEENPFGPGVDYGLDVANQGVPRLERMKDGDDPENVDTPEEIEFGKEKQKARAKILEMDQAYLNERENRRGKIRTPYADDGPAILPRIRPSKHESDLDSTRSTPPPKSLGRGGPGGSNRRGAPLKYQIYDGSSPGRAGTEGVVARKPRPPTAHQLAVERNRHERVEYILDRGLRKQHRRSRKLRKQDGAIFRAYKRVEAQEDPLEDSDGDEAGPRNLTPTPTQPFREQGIGGLCVLASEKDDYGEEVSAYAVALRRCTRRLERWHDQADVLGVVAPTKRPKANGGGGVDKEVEGNGVPGIKINGDANGDVTMDDIELEEADQTALGDDERGDEDIDDPDRTEVLGESDTEVVV
jgi:Ino eighty subunit 1